MKTNTTQHTAPKDKKKLNEESKLCFGAAAGCFVVGAFGWLVNLVQPQTTLLQGLLVVAGFYGFLGVVSLFKRPASTELADHQTPANAAYRTSSVRTDKRLESAA